jgi:ATP-dependent Clp protease ATP-binding subunit ClpC
MEPRITEKILVRAIFSGGFGSAMRILDMQALDTGDVLRRLDNLKTTSIKREIAEDQTKKLYPELIIPLGQPIPQQIYPYHASPGGRSTPHTREAPVTDVFALFGRDLTVSALSRKLPRIVGREKEIEELCLCLRRARLFNPVIIGEHGMGRTALVEGLAQFCAGKEASPQLRNLKILEVSKERFSHILTSSKEGEVKLKDYLERASQHRTILYLKGIFELVDDDKVIWPALMGGLNIIKNYAGEGRIRLLPAVNMRLFERHILLDPFLGKNCQKIEIRELDRESTMEVAREITPRFEKHHQVKIQESQLTLAVELASEYIKDCFLPGKVIDVLDEACAAAAARQGAPGELLDEDIIHAVARKSGLPEEKISRRSQKFKHMEEELGRKIIGQDDAIKAVSDRVRLFMTGFHQEHRPLGVLFFAGPTGVGKTELARVTAEFLFGKDTHFHRFDMSEYSQPHEVSRLVGSPPGYVGFEEEGQLTGKVREDPYCVILLDEMEKAHPRVFDMFLQVFDAGRLTDGKGTTVDFRNTLIIMTSNAGAALWDLEKNIGFRHKDGETVERTGNFKERLLEHLKETFNPEFINRMDEVVLFRPLAEKDIEKITSLIIEEWQEKSRKRDILFTVTEELRGYLMKEGYSKEFGVRNMKRTIENILIIPLSKKLIEGDFTPGDSFLVDFRAGEVVFSGQNDGTTKAGKEND